MSFLKRSEKLFVKKVVIVDDEKDIADLVKLVLETVEYSVRIVLDPTEAVEAIKDFKPSVVLLDLSMPKMNGWEVFKELRADVETKDIPIGILTAKSEDFDTMVGLHVMNADGYITKPFGKQELIEKTDELISKRK